MLGPSETSVVVVIGESNPAFVALALDIRLGAFALRIERIELLIESFFGRLARVDRAPIADVRDLRVTAPATSSRWPFALPTKNRRFDDIRLPVRHDAYSHI